MCLTEGGGGRWRGRGVSNLCLTGGGGRGGGVSNLCLTEGVRVQW